jgi:hypothetical protein
MPEGSQTRDCLGCAHATASLTDTLRQVHLLEPTQLDESSPAGGRRRTCRAPGRQTRRSPSWSVLETEAERAGRRLGRGPRLWLAMVAVAALLGLAEVLLTALSPHRPPAPVSKPLAQREQPKDAAAVAWDRWLGKVARLPAEWQVEAVAAKLKERNPGFAGKVTPTVKDGAVVDLGFLADEVTDLTPLRALPKLKRLVCEGSNPGRGKLADLSPLKGMQLTCLTCPSTRVADLSPLKGMPLTDLNCDSTKVADLSPLKGMPLTSLYCDSTRVADLSPLMGMPLTFLDCGFTKVADLSPLKGMLLTYLNCAGTKVADLSPLKGMPLTTLACGGTKVVDLSPLRGMPLQELFCDFRPERDTEILRSLKTLKTINNKSAAQFWKEAGNPSPPKP